MTTALANNIDDTVTTNTAKTTGPSPLRRRRCTECGAEFYTRYKAFTCSDKCRRKRARRMATKKARSVTGNKP